MNEFGEKLRKLRKEKGFSIRKLSELSGVAHSYLSQVETGKRGIPKVETLEKIATGLNIPSIDLIKATGYISTFANVFSDKTQEYSEKVDEIYDEKQFELDSLLASDHHIFFKDRLLSKEEKTKIKSLIEIVLKD
ncbi:helix-turn-helix domain-containing protein [Bacillus timonensis]|uniref:helix-turn-helix domain-containing protein n=1 Tax=Bacillus timonensis TaxID=1033734 RepID=UPI0002885C06|nr:helix-turn-helix transcriptional regulator [Bacillus timonensis]